MGWSAWKRKGTWNLSLLQTIFKLNNIYDTLQQGYSIGGPRAKSGPGVIFTGPLSIMLKSNPFLFLKIFLFFGAIVPLFQRGCYIER